MLDLKPWRGRQSVEAVRKTVEIERHWDTAENFNKLHSYLLRAAQSVGRAEPYSADEVALNIYLAERMAGKHLCHYAWGMLALG